MTAPVASPASERSARLLVIDAERAERNYWFDVWAYRKLFAILAWRDLAVRYKQTLIGVAWAVIRPLLTLVIFTVLFSRVAKLPSAGGAPYALMVLAGLLPWTLFSTILGEASASLVTNANLIGKVYFPRLIVPASTVVVALADFAVTLLLMFAIMLWYRFLPDWRLLLLPCYVGLTILAALGPSLMMATMNVKYRDFRYVLPFVMQFGLYVSPVGYTSEVVPAAWRTIFALNPVVGIIDGFRWCLLAGEAPFNPTSLLLTIGMSLASWCWASATSRRRAHVRGPDLMADPAISARGVGKKYVIGHAAERGGYVSMRDVLARKVRSLGRAAADLAKGRPNVAGDTLEDFWALKDVDFDISPGDVVGIIGRNGAGKSTLLKVLSRITQPSEGRLEIRGRMASLLEVGTGFHPELSGRENIYLNGAILGMARAEIKRKFDQIVDFAEVERFSTRR